MNLLTETLDFMKELGKTPDDVLYVKMKLALAYADREKADNNAEIEFQTGMIDFYEYIMDYE